MAELKMFSVWYNYAKDEYEYRTEPPQTDEEAVQFIPQIPTAQGLYTCHRKMGKDILEAMRLTLTSCVGEAA